MEKIVRCPVLLDDHDDVLETRRLRVSEQRPKEKQQRSSKGEFHSVVGRRNYLRERARIRAVAAINDSQLSHRRDERGEDDVITRRFAAFSTLIALWALRTLAIHSQRDPSTN